MKIFEPREIEFKTGRSKDEVKERFKKRASITGDEFSIHSEPFAVFARTYVRGKITTTPEWTVVSFTIYPSSFLKGMLFIPAVVATVIGLVALISELACGQSPYLIFGVLVFLTISVIAARVTFEQSADRQETSIRWMIRY
jgi:hypothetical protein